MTCHTSVAKDRRHDIEPSRTSLPDIDSDSPEPVPMSEELHAPVSTDVELCYQTFGDPAGDPLSW